MKYFTVLAFVFGSFAIPLQARAGASHSNEDLDPCPGYKISDNFELLVNHGCINLIEKYYSKHPGPYIKDSSSTGSLIVSAIIMTRDPEVVRVLLKHGEDPNEFDAAGTPLLLAIQQNDLTTTRLLIENGADIEKEDRHGDSFPLLVAARHDDLILFRYLLKKGANPGHKNRYGETPLHKMAININTDGLYMLIKRGVDVNQRHEDGTTPLMLAAIFGRIINVQILVEAGAKVEIKNKRGETALTHALKRGHTNIVEYLKSKGAKVPPGFKPPPPCKCKK